MGKQLNFLALKTRETPEIIYPTHRNIAPGVNLSKKKIKKKLFTPIYFARLFYPNASVLASKSIIYPYLVSSKYFLVLYVNDLKKI